MDDLFEKVTSTKLRRKMKIADEHYAVISMFANTDDVRSECRALLGLLIAGLAKSA
jgi:hypothetical protein